MTATIDSTPAKAAFEYERKGRWIEDWHPENDEFWENGGKKTANKNLIFSVWAEHLGFCVWVIWAVFVTQMGNAGFAFLAGLGKDAHPNHLAAVSNALLLTSIPVLVGSALRIPYTFAIPKFGGRAFTTFSATMLLVPTLGLAYFINDPTTPMWVFVVLAGLAGVGGGNFSSSMANISFFFPEGKKGAALGINAAGGNLGVAVTQLFLPMIVVLGTTIAAKDPAGYRLGLTIAALFFVPQILIAAACAYRFMDSLTAAKPDGKSYKAALTSKHTAIMSFLYIGTFGSFIGFSFAFPTLIKANFPDLAKVELMVLVGNLAFLGALVGSMSRPFGGWLADKIGSGAKLTLGVFVGMAGSVGLIVMSLDVKSFPMFLISFLLLFVLAGAGNGTTYRMIPMIYSAEARKKASETGTDISEAIAGAKRQAGAAIGVIGAVGAFGGFIVQQALRISNKELGSMVPAFWTYAVVFLVMGAVTWFVYLRSSFAVDKVPSLAYASV
ncbi:MAG: MFS transporter [Nocardiaceae bacterium]|nr:MFS transporter [Nocardiaceae bacterium]